MNISGKDINYLYYKYKNKYLNLKKNLKINQSGGGKIKLNKSTTFDIKLYQIKIEIKIKNETILTPFIRTSNIIFNRHNYL